MPTKPQQTRRSNPREAYSSSGELSIREDEGEAVVVVVGEAVDVKKGGGVEIWLTKTFDVVVTGSRSVYLEWSGKEFNIK